MENIYRICLKDKLGKIAVASLISATSHLPDRYKFRPRAGKSGKLKCKKTNKQKEGIWNIMESHTTMFLLEYRCCSLFPLHETFCFRFLVTILGDDGIPPSKLLMLVILLMEKSGVHQLRLAVFLSIHRVLYIPGGAGFLNHQQYD